jgi:hypothetical protein
MTNWSEEYNYAIFKYNVSDNSYYLLPVAELPATGFSSLYYITEASARAIENSGFAGFRGTVWSPSIWIDTDTEEGAMETEAALRALGVAFYKYDTGNRGAHFEIARPHSPSHLLPQIDKQWVADNFNKADLTIYSGLHLFRLEGCIHEKTGRIKSRLYSSDGHALTLPDALQVSNNVLIHRPSITSTSIFMDDYIMTSTVPFAEGERHFRMINLGVAMKKQGEPIEFISRWLYHSNLLNNPPMDDAEMDSIVEFIARAE